MLADLRDRRWCPGDQRFPGHIGQRGLFGICGVIADGIADVDGDRRRPALAGRRTVGAVSTARRHQGHRAGLHSTSLHRLEAAAIFYPNFYPKRQCSGVEMVYLLVTASNWSGRPECVTSLPSWSCGFDSRPPLQPNGDLGHPRGRPCQLEGRSGLASAHCCDRLEAALTPGRHRPG
jgi:hypothetical protein